LGSINEDIVPALDAAGLHKLYVDAIAGAVAKRAEALRPLPCHGTVTPKAAPRATQRWGPQLAADDLALLVETASEISKHADPDTTAEAVGEFYQVVVEVLSRFGGTGQTARELLTPSGWWGSGTPVERWIAREAWLRRRGF
jgi:hypothetical protein